MNAHAKRCEKALLALGFKRDHDYLSKKARAYRHPNQPDQVLKVFDAMTDTSITMVLRKANKIADTGWSGPRKPQTVKERAKITREREKARAERDRQARAEREQAAKDAGRLTADEREALRRRDEREVAMLRHQRDIQDLMQPKHGH